MTKSTITRESITHDLKIYPEFFSAVCTGVKRAELRKNDRDYRVGDTLHLMETPRGSCHRTGEFINVTITHIADVGEWMPGYVLLSVELQERRKADSEPVAEVLSNRPGNGTSIVDRALPVGTQLYRHAQPALVVPDEVTAEDCPALVKYDVTEVDEAWARGFNACRAAMLQASPVCTCPSGDGSLRWPCPAHPGNSPAQSYCCPAQNSVSPAQNGIAPAQSPIDHGYRPECECSGCKATARICAELSVNSPANPDCWCRTCRPVVLNDMRFVVCPDCGNKRCPRANDHRNACTGSNEPGQEGSAYPDTPPRSQNHDRGNATAPRFRADLFAGNS
ncbi:DUF3850 domain-containing protein [Klebsiella pneumoniae]